MPRKSRDIGAEILQGLREIKRGEYGRVINVPYIARIREKPPGTRPPRPRLKRKRFERDYKAMAEDEGREAEALAWSEGSLGNVRDETR